MKTNMNSKTTKGIVIGMLALTLTAAASAQKPVIQSSYADNRVKNFVYNVTDRVYQRLNYLVHFGKEAQLVSTSNMNNETARPVYTSYTSSENRVKSDRRLENFLIQAAGLTSRVNETEVASMEEAMNDNALESILVEASGLRESVEMNESMEIEANNVVDNALEEYLIHASGLKMNNETNEVYSPVENEVADFALESMLTEASGLKNPVEFDKDNAIVSENNTSDVLEESLIRASGLRVQQFEINN
jgi:hypothetical protein